MVVDSESLASADGGLTEIATSRKSRLDLLGGVVDQGLSSLTNFAPQVAAASLLTDVRFATLSIGFLVTLLTIEVVRALTGEVLLVLPPDADSRPSGNTMFSAAAILSIGLTVIVAVGASAVTAGELRTTIVIGLAVAPVVCVQDVLRFMSFSRSDMRAVLANDGLWCIVLVGCYAAYLSVAEATPAGLLAVWGLSCLPVVVIVGATNQIRPIPSWPRNWFRETNWRGVRFSAEYLADRGSAGIGLLVAGAISGSLVVTTVRSAQLIVAPVLVLIGGLSYVLAPRAVRLAGATRSEFDRWIVSRALALSVVASGLALLITFVPSALDEQASGDVWSQGTAVRVPLLIYIAAGSISIVLRLGVRAKSGERRSLQVRLVTFPVLLASPVLGAAIDGGNGCMWGVAVSTMLVLAAWIHTYLIASREYTYVPMSSFNRSAEERG